MDWLFMYTTMQLEISHSSCGFLPHISENLNYILMLIGIRNTVAHKFLLQLEILRVFVSFVLRHLCLLVQICGSSRLYIDLAWHRCEQTMTNEELTLHTATQHTCLVQCTQEFCCCSLTWSNSDLWWLMVWTSTSSAVPLNSTELFLCVCVFSLIIPST